MLLSRPNARPHFTIGSAQLYLLALCSLTLTILDVPSRSLRSTYNAVLTLNYSAYPYRWVFQSGLRMLTVSVIDGEKSDKLRGPV